MSKIQQITCSEEIPEQYRGTPIQSLIEYHNFDKPFSSYEAAEILVGMCMDHRKQLRIPDNFAYILRSGGGNLRHSEFKVSYAIAVGGVRALALFAHNCCGMVNLMSKQEQFVDGLVEHGGWDRQWAEEHFWHFAPMFEIGNEIDFVLSEAQRLRLRYPKILVAPLLYKLEDGRIYSISES